MNRREGHPLLSIGLVCLLLCWSLCCLLLGWLLPTAAGAEEPRALTPEQEVAVAVARARALPAWVNAADRKLATRVADLIRQGKTEAAEAEWRKLVLPHAGARDIEQLKTVGNWIVREALLVSRPALDQKAFKLAETRDLRVALGSYLAELRSVLGKVSAAPGVTIAVRIKVVDKGKLVDRGTKPLTRAQIEAAIQSTETELSAAGDMSRLDQLALQDALQKQQQMLQTISSIMKTQHDTLKAIIQNLRG
jgi:hypothetical protein